MDKIWKIFERIAYEYVSQFYKNSVKSEHTADSHDSGYDGIWIIPCDNKILYEKIMMEAKYRESQISLPLNDCAKAIIIAFNSCANKLYIVTNIELAPQTQMQIINFNKRTTLAIIHVDNSKLKNYIHENKKYLAQICKTNENVLSDLENKIVCKLDIANDTFNGDLTKYNYLFDLKREKTISNIVNELCNKNKKVILTGDEGIGKSVLIDKICIELQNKKYDTQKIDLNFCTSSRILYLKILEAVWGVSLDYILCDADLETYIDKLLAINNNSIKSIILNAVKHIMLMNIYEYEGANDIYRYYLLKYLNAILQNKKSFFHLIVVFENVNSLPEENVNFFLDIVNLLKRNGINTLLEIRTPFMLMDDINKSNNYYKLISQDSLVHSLSPLSEDILYKLIREYIKLNKDSAKQFSDMLGNNPLKIKNALDYIKHTCININVAKINKMSNEEREIFWNAQGIDANKEIISLINQLRTNCLFSELLEMVLILNGKIPYLLLHTYWGENTDIIYELAVNSRLFEFKENNLQCIHLRVLKAIEITSDSFQQIKMANRLLPIIQEKNNEWYVLIQLKLLYILDLDNKIGESTINVMSMYEDSQQYKQSLDIGEKYIDRLNKKGILTKNEKKTIIYIMLRLLNCIYELHLDNEQQYEYLYLQTKHKIFLYIPNYTSCKEWYEYSLFIWHKKFIAGLFNDAYEISKRLYDNLANILHAFDEKNDIAGRIYSAHGLSIKMIKGANDATTLFKEGIEKYPESYNAYAAYLSQEGNNLLKEEPIKSIDKYTKLLNIVEGKNYPFLEILHTRIDIAMSYFLAEKYDDAAIWADEGLSIASTLGIHIQKGRALNILACCKIANGIFVGGLKSFKDSIFYLELSGATIYKWRALLNQASVLLYKGNKKEAKLIISEVVNVLLSDFIQKIKSDNKSVPYQSLLLILMYLHDLKENEENILNKFEGTLLRKEFKQLCQKTNWKENFQNKVKYCNGIVLVTG